MLQKIQIVLISLFLLLTNAPLRAQDFESGNRFSVSLLKDTLVTGVGSFGFNTLSITNMSSTHLTVSTKIDLPQGWNLLRNLPTSVSIEPGNTITIPFRIKTAANAYGTVKYPVSLTIQDQMGGNPIKAGFVTLIQSNTSWRAELLQSTIFVPDTESLPDFKFRISNNGNKIEAFDISFQSELRLTYPSAGFQLFLKPGQDTVFVVGIRSRTLNQVSDVVRIHINSRAMKKTLQQKIYISSNQYIPRENSNYEMSMSVRWQGANLLSPDNRFNFLEADGILELENFKSFSFRIRANTTEEEFSNRDNFFQFNYHTKNINYSVGSQQEFIYSQVDGVGTKVDLRLEKSLTEAFAIKSRLADEYVFGLNQKLQVQSKLLLTNNLVYRDNKESGLKSGFAVHTFKHFTRDNSRSFWELAGGYSFEQHANLASVQPGFLLGAQVYENSKRLLINSNFRLFSGSFPGLNRGMLTQSHDLRLKLGKVFIGAFGNQANRTSSLYYNDFTDVRDVFAVKNLEYGAQLGVGLWGGNLFWRASQISQLQFDINNPVMEGNQLSINYFVKKNKFEQMLTMSTLRGKLATDVGKPSEQSYSTTLRGKIKNFGYNSRFDYGPVFYFDFLYASRNNVFPIRQQHSIFYENQRAKYFLNRSSINYFSYSQIGNQSLFIQNNSFFDIPKYGLSFNVLASYNVFANSQPFGLNISVSKALNVPIPFLKKYNTIKLSLFQDDNNNNIKDEGEGLIEDATVQINDKYLTSDANGEILLKNMNKGDYNINFTSSNKLMGWSANLLKKDTIRLRKDVFLEIPYKKSKIVTGKIEVQKSEYSILTTPDVDGIRVIAINSIGEQFRSVTNKEGEFFFNLNDDEYMIIVPNNLYSDDFKFTNNTAKVNLNLDTKNHVVFTLQEKKRKINIKKMD